MQGPSARRSIRASRSERCLADRCLVRSVQGPQGGQVRRNEETRGASVTPTERVVKLTRRATDPAGQPPDGWSIDHCARSSGRVDHATFAGGPDARAISSIVNLLWRSGIPNGVSPGSPNGSRPMNPSVPSSRDRGDVIERPAAAIAAGQSDRNDGPAVGASACGSRGRSVADEAASETPSTVPCPTTAVMPATPADAVGPVRGGGPAIRPPTASATIPISARGGASNPGRSERRLPPTRP